MGHGLEMEITVSLNELPVSGTEIPQELVGPLVEAIEETVCALLGLEVLNSLYLHLEKYQLTPKNQVPYNLDKLLVVLEKTFGPAGAGRIGKVIARRLFSKLNLAFIESRHHGLLDYVEEATTMLQNHRSAR